MNKILGGFILSVLSFNSFADSALDIEYNNDLLRQRTYNVQVLDSSSKVLFESEVNTFNSLSNEKIKEGSFIDNCALINGKIQNDYSNVNEGLKVAIQREYIYPKSITIDLVSLIKKNKINTGECFIEEPIIGKKTILQTLPFAYYKETFKLNDLMDSPLTDEITVIVSSKKNK